MILVTGPTGNIGSLLIEELVRRNAPCRALIRNHSSGSKLSTATVELAHGDLSRPESLPAAMEGVEAAFLLTPVSEQTAELKHNFIQAARQAGVRRVVNLSAAGANANAGFSLGRWHAAAERELEESGMEWTHLRPVDLARYAIRTFMATVSTDGVFYSTLGDGKVAPVDEADVAEAAAVALLDSSHSGRSYDLTGPDPLTYDEIAAVMSSVLGKPVRYVNLTREQARGAMVKMGLPEWLADFINDLKDAERAGLVPVSSPAIQMLCGHPAIDFATTLRAYLKREN